MFNFNSNTTLKTIAISAIVTFSAAMAPMASHAINDKILFKVDAADLTTQAGIERIYNRLESEAERACSTTGRITLDTRKLEKACKIEVMDDFVESVDNKALTAFHLAMKSSK